MRPFTFAVSAIPLLLCLLGCGNEPGRDQRQTIPAPQPSPKDEPYLTRKASFHTQLRKKGPSPQRWTDDPVPDGVSKVDYESDGRKLKAWLFKPKPGKQEKRPALVYLHGGFAFGKDDFTDCQPFAQAGFVVMCPTFRGENGNPGNFEMVLGEVDDAAAAIRWLAKQKEVDPDKIYAFGHSSGGIMAAMLSLYDQLPVHHTGSAGGLYGPHLFTLMPEIVPFDPENNSETQIRVLIGNLRWMKRPHHAFIGKNDLYMQKDAASHEAKASRAPLKIIELPGDHHSSLAPAIREYLKIALQEK